MTADAIRMRRDQMVVSEALAEWGIKDAGDQILAINRPFL